MQSCPNVGLFVEFIFVHTQMWDSGDVFWNAEQSVLSLKWSSLVWMPEAAFNAKWSGFFGKVCFIVGGLSAATFTQHRRGILRNCIRVVQCVFCSDKTLGEKKLQHLAFSLIQCHNWLYKHTVWNDKDLVKRSRWRRPQLISWSQCWSSLKCYWILASFDSNSKNFNFFLAILFFPEVVIVWVT